MDRKTRHRQKSVSSGRQRRTSHHGSQSSRRSSNRKTEESRQHHSSSGYGSLSESHDESTSKLSAPPPDYRSHFTDELVSSSHDSTAENIYESIPERETADETFIHTKERVSAVRFRGRSNAFSAPDMLLDSLTSRDNERFQAEVNGRLIDYTAMRVLTLDEGRSMLIEHARPQFKLPTKVARKCVINNTEYEIAFRYQLTTLTERRVMEKGCKPYRGEKIPTYRPRSAWDFTISKPQSFQDLECYFKVPNSEKVITCKSCQGSGKGRCTVCDGAGLKMCPRCHGFGQEPMSNTDCSQCGSGFEICLGCHGSGVGKCVECDGNRKLILFQRLKVTWNAEEYVYVDAVAGVPKKKLMQATGRLVHKDVCDGYVEPIGEEDLFHSKIVRDSERQIARYRDVGRNVCKQKQTVRLVLAQRFDCQYKEKPFSFHVIGKGKEVYAPYYPNRRFKFLDFFSGKK